MDLREARIEIDEVDAEMTRLFARRMDIAAEIAEYKRQNNLPVFDPGRERAKLQEIGEQTPAGIRTYAESLYRMLFELSRACQRDVMGGESPLQKKIEAAIQNTPQQFPPRARVACQGVEGAYSQRACEKLFALPNILYFDSFEGVFRAIDQGLCQYGVLPLENSTAGSVNRVYDLMTRYDFSIVRATRLKIEHCLLAAKGARLEDIKEVVSHEQALSQCEGFLRGLQDVKATAVENTAAAAKRVSESGRRDLAALASRDCAELYGLSCLKENAQDNAGNFTRFICISKSLEIYPGANKTSVMLTLPHKPGSLYTALGRFFALGINLSKLESRPLHGSDFEFQFYFDLDTSMYSPEFPRMFAGIEDMCTSFTYLGSYAEVG